MADRGSWLSSKQPAGGSSPSRRATLPAGHGGVTHAVDQLARAGARLGNEVVAGVPQIVEVHSGQTGPSGLKRSQPAVARQSSRKRL